jgi:hypothetical protein
MTRRAQPAGASLRSHGLPGERAQFGCANPAGRSTAKNTCWGNFRGNQHFSNEESCVKTNYQGLSSIPPLAANPVNDLRHLQDGVYVPSRDFA